MDIWIAMLSDNAERVVVDFDQCYQEREQVVIDGVQVNLISLKHLKLNKKATSRNKDLDDLEHLI